MTILSWKCPIVLYFPWIKFQILILSSIFWLLLMCFLTKSLKMMNCYESLNYKVILDQASEPSLILLFQLRTSLTTHLLLFSSGWSHSLQIQLECFIWSFWWDFYFLWRTLGPMLWSQTCFTKVEKTNYQILIYLVVCLKHCLSCLLPSMALLCTWNRVTLKKKTTTMGCCP